MKERYYSLWDEDEKRDREAAEDSLLQEKIDRDEYKIEKEWRGIMDKLKLDDTVIVST